MPKYCRLLLTMNSDCVCTGRNLESIKLFPGQYYRMPQSEEVNHRNRDIELNIQIRIVEEITNKSNITNNTENGMKI